MQSAAWACRGRNSATLARSPSIACWSTRRCSRSLVALVLAIIVARVIDPASKLATARQLDAATGTSSLEPLLELDMVGEQDLYAALDRLLGQQPRIERRLARRHLSQGTLVL